MKLKLRRCPNVTSPSPLMIDDAGAFLSASCREFSWVLSNSGDRSRGRHNPSKMDQNQHRVYFRMRGNPIRTCGTRSRCSRSLRLNSLIQSLRWMRTIRRVLRGSGRALLLARVDSTTHDPIRRPDAHRRLSFARRPDSPRRSACNGRVEYIEGSAGSTGLGSSGEFVCGVCSSGFDCLARNLLPCGRLPGAALCAVEARQTELRAEPEIPIRALCHAVDVAQGEAVPDGPRGVSVLADIQRWIERLSAGAPRQQRDKR